MCCKLNVCGKVKKVPFQPVVPIDCDQTPKGKDKPVGGGKKAKSESKASSPDLDPKRYLSNEGKDKLDQAFLSIQDMLQKNEFAQIAVSPAKQQALQKPLKQLCSELTSVHKSVIDLYWKIKKRLNPPQEALAVMMPPHS